MADLHADSWRRHYRGAYSDAYLDGDVVTDRRSVWQERLGRPSAPAVTILAEGGGSLLGFIHVVFDHDPRWGSLVDNLHVRAASKRSGIGRQLMAAGAAAVLERSDDGRMYLWVLEQNTAAQAFYTALGGQIVERDLTSAPGGDPARLNGTPAKLRCAWERPAVLLKRPGDRSAGEQSDCR